MLIELQSLRVVYWIDYWIELNITLNWILHWIEYWIEDWIELNIELNIELYWILNIELNSIEWWIEYWIELNIELNWILNLVLGSGGRRPVRMLSSVALCWGTSGIVGKDKQEFLSSRSSQLSRIPHVFLGRSASASLVLSRGVVFVSEMVDVVLLCIGCT